MEVELEFYELANILYPYLGEGKKTEDFTRTMLLNATDYLDEEEENPVSNLQGPTLKKYFAGPVGSLANNGLGVSGIAKKISKRIDTNKYVPWINSISEDSKAALADKLRPYCPSMTMDNVGDKVSILIAEILRKAASAKRKPRKRAGVIAATTPIPESINKSIYGIRLLMEAGGYCPVCGAPLYSTMNGETTPTYEVFQIDDSEPETFDNLIAMCPSCYYKYKTGADSYNRDKLLADKKKLELEEIGAMDLSSIRFDEGIERVLRKIKNTPPESLVPLTMAPATVREKIELNQMPLYIKVNGFVTTYFNRVHDVLKQLDKEGILPFEQFCIQMRLAYLKVKDLDVSQQKKFEMLVDRLVNITHEDSDYCAVVVAYFVQKCEVFDAPSK